MGTPADVISGNGTMYIAAWDGTTPPAEEDYYTPGNCIEFNFQPTFTTKKHYNRETGVKAQEKKIVVKKEGTIKFTLDEFSASNLSMFLMGVLSGTTIYPMAADSQEYMLKFVQELQSGTERVYEFWKVSMSAAGAIDLIADGEGDDDWGKLEFEGEVLEDSTNHAGNQMWGRIYLKPTA